MLVLEAMQASDWPDVQSIYLDGIATGNATFETGAPEWEAWNRTHHQFARLVARDSESIMGWAALSPVSARAVYAGVAEVSIYIAARCRGQGVGKLLLGELIKQSEQNGIWTLQAGIFPENESSIVLHKTFGFRELGRREKVGRLHGIWRDVILLERRSRTVGVE